MRPAASRCPRRARRALQSGAYPEQLQEPIDMGYFRDAAVVGVLIIPTQGSLELSAAAPAGEWCKFICIDVYRDLAMFGCNAFVSMLEPGALLGAAASNRLQCCSLLSNSLIHQSGRGIP